MGGFFACQPILMRTIESATSGIAGAAIRSWGSSGTSTKISMSIECPIDTTGMYLSYSGTNTMSVGRTVYLKADGVTLLSLTIPKQTSYTQDDGGTTTYSGGSLSSSYFLIKSVSKGATLTFETSDSYSGAITWSASAIFAGG